MKSNNSKQSTPATSDKGWLLLIGVVSVAVPAIVAWLLYGREKGATNAGAWDFLPALNAGINSSVAVLLILGKWVIRKGQREVHKAIMLAAFTLSLLFLVSYLLYHAQAGDVKYTGTGADRYIYLFILATHIILSGVVVPLALLAIYRGIRGQFEQHKRVVKWTWPVWLYVAVTGVVVYVFAHVINPAANL